MYDDSIEATETVKYTCPECGSIFHNVKPTENCPDCGVQIKED